MPKNKRPDEVFCTACGEPINEQAELCPHCGVPNNHASTNQQVTCRDAPSTHPTISPNWWYGIAIGTALWIVLLIVQGLNVDPAYDPFFGFLLVLAWISLPLSAYFDTQYLQHTTNWEPNTALWVIGLVVWFLNILLGIVYLIRRHETLGTP